MNIDQKRKAETSYIFHNTLLSEISQQMSIPLEEFAEFEHEWEFRRQAYRTAEYFFCRDGKKIKEIVALVPLSLKELTAHLPILEQKRAAYVAATPSAFLRARGLLEQRISNLTNCPSPLVPLTTIQKFYDALKPTASITDHYELSLNIFLHNFLPTKQLDQQTGDVIIALLEDFRGFLKLQLLSGNR